MSVALQGEEKQRRRRGSTLSPDRLDGLGLLTASPPGMGLVTARLKVSAGTVGKYLQGRHFPNLKLRELDALLRGGGPSAPSAATVDPLAPEGRLDALLHAARSAHYERFDAVAAADHIGRLLGQDWPIQVGAELLFERLVAVLAMLRQSACAGTAPFLTAADRCLERLDVIGPLDKGEPVAALACCVAWEMAAVVAQRGAADAAGPLFERVDAEIRRLDLADKLPRGRDRTMTKMRQWAAEVTAARPGRADGGQDLINELLHMGLAHPAEAFNTRHQQLCALSRRALARLPRADDRLLEFFDRHYRPRFIELTDQVRRAGTGGLSSIVTPSTAESAALQAALVAGLVDGCADADDILDRASMLHGAVDAVAWGGVVLHRANRETVEGVRRLAVYRPGIAPAFDLTPDLRPGMTQALLDRGRKILDRVDRCLTRVHPVA